MSDLISIVSISYQKFQINYLIACDAYQGHLK